jgi:chromate transporter
LISDDQLHTESPSPIHAVKVVGIGLVAWAVPVGLVVAVAGRDSIFADMAVFFTGAALVTFGGAYAVLAYVAQQAVQFYGWLTASEMITGLALAETTPGPLIMVVQFVAFVGAYHDPGSLNPWVAAVVASLLTTWVTFVPCFVLVFVGAPYVERLRGNHALSAALRGIMAAVVGVIANLAIYFAIHTRFSEVSTVTFGPVDLQLPDPGSLKPLALTVALFAALLLFRARWSVLRTLGACGLVGLAAGLIELLAT